MALHGLASVEDLFAQGRLPVPACLAQAETGRVSGREFLRAFAIGCEVTCRIGLAVSPEHYARGWHITSTCGIFGAAAGVGALLGLGPGEMLHAFSAAAVRWVTRCSR